YQDDVLIAKPFNWKQMSRLLGYIRPYRKEVIKVAIVMTVFGMLARLAIPLLTKLAIDKAIWPVDGVSGNIKLLILIIGIMLALYGLRWWSSYYTINGTSRIGQKVIFDLRLALFRHIQTLSFRFFDK